jgi:CheY-like chemotaxis protein
MASGIAHDFNNLLTPIVGETSLALQDLDTESALRQPLLKIQRAAHRAAALTNQMLAYSGQGSLLIEPIDLSLLVEEMGELLQSTVSGGAVLSYSLAADLPAIEGDSSQLSQIAMNLISNARESVEEGSGHIAIRTGVMEPYSVEREHIVGSSEVVSDLYVFLEVSDDGCGMEAETRLRIFDPFFTTKFTGRGLGLASVLGIVRGHGGLIVLDSEVGRGTRFQVLLPAMDDPRTQQKTQSETRSPWRSDGTVLVVDDDEGVRDLAETTFRRAGLRVLLASDGRDGLALFRRHANEIQAVVLDRTMPTLGGDTAFEEIRRIQPDVPIILISGYSQDRAIDQIGKTLDAFLQKPFEPATLLDTVRRVVEAKSK